MNYHLIQGTFRIRFYCSHKIDDCRAYLVLCTLKGLPQIRKWSGKKGNLKVREKLECYFKLGNIYTGKVYFFKISRQGNVIVTMNSRGILKTECLNSFMITKKREVQAIKLQIATYLSPA